MRRVYYGLAFVLTGVWAFFTPEAFTDFFTDYSRGIRIVGDTVVFLAVSQCILAIPAWLAFRAWRRLTPMPSIASRLPIYWVAAVGSLVTCGSFVQEFGISIVIATLLANVAVALCLYSPAEIPTAFKATVPALKRLPTIIRNWLKGRETAPAALEPILQPVLDKLYPNFAVSVGAVLYDSTTDKRYRVNSTGLVVDLDKWTLDSNSGEFYKITKRAQGSVIFNAVPYNRRFVHFHSRASKVQVSTISITGFVMTAVGLVLGVCAFTAAEILRPWIVGLSIISLLSGVCLLIARKDFTEERLVGPEPFKMKMQDFGPEAAVTNTPADIANELAYKPSV